MAGTGGWRVAVWRLSLWVLLLGSAEAAGVELEVLGNFETPAPERATYDQSISDDETLVMRWPGVIETDGTIVAMAFEPVDDSHNFRQANGGDSRRSLSWASLTDSRLSSYRLQRKANGGFVLEAVHRTPIPNGIRVRWSVIRDGRIVERGDLEALRAGIVR